MCMKQLIKSTYLFASLCLMTIVIWIFILYLHSIHTSYSSDLDVSQGKSRVLPKLEKPPKILTYVTDIRQQYRGPFHRYRHVNGKWRRIEGQSATLYTKKRKIPHIIHQTWDNDKLPQRFLHWVVTWVKHHPSWEYWFWTPEDVRGLVHKNYPKYDETYAAYKQSLLRADAMRYFVLHSFGGVYADLDTQCLKPLDELVDKYPCFLSQETYEHAHLLYFRNPPNLMTTIMACRPSHPLFLVAIRALPYTQKRYQNDVLKATGPFFMDSLYRYYLDQSPEFRSIKILQPEYLLPTYDASQSSSFERVCMDVNDKSPQYLRNTCKKWDEDRRLNNRPTNKSYTNHYWVHVMLSEKMWRNMKAIDIEQAVNMKPKPKAHMETTTQVIMD